MCRCVDHCLTAAYIQPYPIPAYRPVTWWDRMWLPEPPRYNRVHYVGTNRFAPPAGIPARAPRHLIGPRVTRGFPMQAARMPVVVGQPKY